MNENLNTQTPPNTTEQVTEVKTANDVQPNAQIESKETPENVQTIVQNENKNKTKTNKNKT